MGRRMRFVFTVVGVGLFCLTQVQRDATAQVYGQSLQKLTQKSELIVTGIVVDKHSEWNPEKTKIFTRVKVNVDAYQKGDGIEESLTVTHLGGEVGEIGELYTGVPKFEQGEEVFLFLRRDEKGNLRVTGSDRGKLTIRTDEQTGKKMIARNRTLDDFKVQVTSMVNRLKLE